MKRPYSAGSSNTPQSYAPSTFTRSFECHKAARDMRTVPCEARSQFADSFLKSTQVIEVMKR